MKADKFKVTLDRDQRLDDNEWHDVYFTKRNKQVYNNNINNNNDNDKCQVI